ncbi:spindle pole body component 110-like [Dorcoceras hygrometricum]|uniref:Spindle pole body component 110-like n=1 Tax=Dorcoceras hygrometricum TaxID=472368 RepID=A0A2Z7BST9_9LAMI|nr:spindle pole body component 110-like [Dorcoceras hygrometricum]
MVKEYRKLSHSFEEVKAENSDLKNSSAEPSAVELGEADSLKIELSKLTAENELLREESSELKVEIESLIELVSSWNQSYRSLHKLQEIQKPANDRTGLGFNSSDSSEGETSVRVDAQLANLWRFLVDWAVKMRIRPPELETSICDAKYHVSLSTRSVLGKCVCLVTLAMSLFDLQDVCMAIGSIATLDIPIVVELIGIYGLKGPYCTLTTTNWFLQALSVIPRGSWGDVARRSYHDPLGKSEIVIPEPQWLWAHG